MSRVRDIVRVVEVAGARFHHLAIADLVVVEPEVHGDHRGFFLETHHRRKYAEGGIDVDFVQDNHSRSKPGILRGLHTQIERPQGKLLRAVEGAIFDVAVDVRRGSETFGEWYGTELSAENFRQLYVPPGFLHGFSVLSDGAQVEYKCTDFYDPEDEVTVLWSDPELGIDWRVADPVLSERDRKARPLKEVPEVRDGIVRDGIVRDGIDSPG